MIPLVSCYLAGTPEQTKGSVEIYGTKLVGVNSATEHKLVLTVIFIVALVLIRWLLGAIAKLLLKGRRSQRLVFVVRQVSSIVVALITIIGLLSIWFNDPARFATFMGLVSAGVAFALQKPITAIAGYIVILRGSVFNVGDRITMGGVRGDVIALSFIRTTIMEMGEPPDVQQADPAMWVEARQYTGRIAMVSNSAVFDTPVYNYTREFPFIWEEMRLPVSYKDDRHRAEQILLEVADRHTVNIQELSEEHLKELERRYFIERSDLKPQVYWRITDNWLELTCRFIVRTHGIRALKNDMSREILRLLDEAKIGIASDTYDVVGMPPIQVELKSAQQGILGRQDRPAA